ncbi:MAG: hypothetical protein ACI9OJ_002691, partial [Myxococcota bacterium]
NAPLVNALGWEGTLRRLCGVLVSTPQFMLVGNPQATQEQVPRLVLNGSYETICDAYAAAAFDPLEWTVTCSEDGVLITPYLPPLGGL